MSHFEIRAHCVRDAHMVQDPPTNWPITAPDPPPKINALHWFNFIFVCQKSLFVPVYERLISRELYMITILILPHTHPHINVVGSKRSPLYGSVEIDYDFSTSR